jgi:chemotaxis protein MotB
MAKTKSGQSGDTQPVIVIKKVKKVAGGHHGGAWKVAYADFVTAMMAFFLLLWLLSVTTSEQRAAIANFFDPTHPTIHDSQSGAGGVMGGTSISTEGAMTTTFQEISMARNSGLENKNRKQGESGGQGQDSAAQKLEQELRRREDTRFEQAKAEIEQQIQKTPELAELKKHLMMEITPEGLQIQIIDQEGEPMFPSGSAQMFDKTRRIVTLAAEVIRKMPNDVSVRGHTDSSPYRAGATYTNWELSADRANATRRVLMEAGIPESRFSNVIGKADTDHLVPDQPKDARNRRITVVLEREDIETMIEREGISAARAIGEPDSVNEMKQLLRDAAEQPYRRTQGNVYFP